MGIITEITEFFFPSNIYCIGCGSIIDRSRLYALCDMCMEEYRFAVGRTCRKCGKLLAENNIHELCGDCREHGRLFDKGYCCLQYGSREKIPLFALKYGDKAYIGRKLGEMLYDRLAAEEPAVDVIVPVPLSAARRRERGYNQAAVAAREVSRRMKAPYCEALRRTRDTKPMSGLSKADREENLKNAFTIAPHFSKMIDGGKILLIDDIFTTGSTADACSRVLRAAGAEYIYFAAIASGADMTTEN